MLKCTFFQGGYCLGMAFPPNLGHIFDLTEFETAGGACGDAGRLKPFINTVLAVIALYHFASVRVPLGGSPGAGGDAGFAAYAKVFFNKDNAVAGSFLHGSRGAGSNAPGVFTMETGHENKR